MPQGRTVFEDGTPEQNMDSGIFFAYNLDSGRNRPAHLCSTKEFLFAFYGGLLWYLSRLRTTSDRHVRPEDCLFSDDEKWNVYNKLKSPIVDWYISTSANAGEGIPDFSPSPRVGETVSMWAEWGDGLFWHQHGGCSGNAERFFIDARERPVDLTGLPELRAWYDEFDDSDPSVEWPEEKTFAWMRRGWMLACRIRTMMPENVDLFFQWKVFSLKGQECAELPIIVPDGRRLEIKEKL